jgi:hypothetical protein
MRNAYTVLVGKPVRRVGTSTKFDAIEISIEVVD